MKEITAYLNFDGKCREAMAFYQSCLGGELYVMTFKEANAGTPPEANDRLMHARLKNGPTVIMASDTMPGAEYRQGNDLWMCIACDSDEEVNKLFATLAAGGKGVMPPDNMFWGSYFAMLTDKYGFNWMLNHEHVKPE